jgi:hypothetical protein
MEIPIDLNNEIIDYCLKNKIDDIQKFKLKLLKQGFTIEKFGTPNFRVNNQEEKENKKEHKEIVEEIKPKTTDKKDLYGEL